MLTVLLPEPDAPTSATVSPGATRSEKSRSTGSDAQVAVRHAVDDDVAVGDDEVAGGGLLGDDRVGVEDLEDPLRCSAGLRRHRDDLGEHAHWREELDEIAGERGERPERDLAVDRQPPAEREHGDLPEGGDRPAAATSTCAWMRTLRTRER